MKLRYGPWTVETSNDDKVLYPDAGLTKADVIDYYRSVADLMLPHFENRCLTIQRFPEGIGTEGFYQQSRSDYFPDFVAGKTLEKADRSETVEHIVVNNEAALVYLADQAALTFHGWLSRTGEPRHPDRIVFDLDPAGEDFDTILDCAKLLRDALERTGLVPFVMTTGSRGLHVVSPLSAKLEFDDARQFARTVAEAVAARQPERFTTAQRKKARKGRLYIDIGRNAYGQTAVLPYSLRAIEGAPAATPLDWDELARGDLSPRRFHLENMNRRMAQKNDPFAEFFQHKRTPDAGKLDDW